MRKVIVGAMISLDGVMQAPGGPQEDPTGGFSYGGWVAPLADEVFGEEIGKMFSQPFDLLLGRKTYEIFAAHWPYAEGGPDDSLAKTFNSITKYVATRKGLDLTWKGSVALRDAATDVAKLKQEDGPALVTQGSTDLIRTLLASDLVDEINMFTFPVVLGGGKRLFDDGATVRWKPATLPWIPPRRRKSHGVRRCSGRVSSPPRNAGCIRFGWNSSPRRRITRHRRRAGKPLRGLPAAERSVRQQERKDHAMRKLIMWNLITLDGYFEGAKSWDLPWHERVWGEELERFSLEQLESADMLVFGRVTYEGMAAYWQTAQGKIADYMNSLPKVVCSRTLQAAAWNNTALVKDNVVGEVAKLKQHGNGNIFVFGSANLSKTLMNGGLFDEYRLGIAPVIHGNGRLLFSDGLKPQGLELLETRPLSTGCVILRYQRMT